MSMSSGYTTFGTIENEIIRHYETTGEKINFRDAIFYLKKNSTHIYEKSSTPDFLSWNLINIQDLLPLINQIPVQLSYVTTIKPQFNSNTNKLFLPTKRPIQICLESYYAPDTLLSLSYFTIIYVLKGKCIINFENTGHSMKTGELYIIAPDTPHQVDITPGNIVLNIMSDQPHFKDNFFQLMQKNNILSAFFRNALYGSDAEYLYFMVEPTLEIRYLIQHLFQEYVSEDQYSQTLFNNYLQILYSHIIRSYENTYHYFANKKELTSKSAIPAILQYIREHYHTITLEHLARHFHYNSAYLSKVIKSATGENYSSIVTNFKLEEAKKLLTTTDLKIEKISELAGYHSPDQFTYSFKQLVGMTPRDYRKQG